jgi:aspartate/methionine/tyrosine aminotransferase
MPRGKIPELDELSALDELAEDYRRHHGCEPYNLSHWDPSELSVRFFLQHLVLPPPPAPAQYIYPYELELGADVIRRLGISPDARDCLLVPNGTSAILFAVWWLRARGINHVIVLCPSYFPVFHACKMLGLKVTYVYMQRERTGWHLPADEVLRALSRAPKTAVWMTNPVYCAGVYMGESEANFINSLLDRGFLVVADECLSINGRELSRLIRPNENFLGLYSPHKSVCINAVKFAAIVFDVKYSKFFADWTDVLIGGLGASSHSAIMHFVGDNFGVFQEAFIRYINSVRAQVAAIVNEMGAMLELDGRVEGYFLTLYAPTVQAGRIDEFFRDMVFGSGAIVIPGSRNHFSSATGFNFRINLARASPQFFSALRRIVVRLGNPD